MTTFGDYIRAARLGYHWHEKTGAFIRIAADGPPWRFDVRSAGHLPNRPYRNDNRHRVWWEGDADPLDYVALKLEPNRTYFFGDDGRPTVGSDAK